MACSRTLVFGVDVRTAHFILACHDELAVLLCAGANAADAVLIQATRQRGSRMRTRRVLRTVVSACDPYAAPLIIGCFGLLACWTPGAACWRHSTQHMLPARFDSRQVRERVRRRIRRAPRTSVSTLDQCAMPVILGCFCFFLGRSDAAGALPDSSCSTSTGSSSGGGTSSAVEAARRPCHHLSRPVRGVLAVGEAACQKPELVCRAGFCGSKTGRVTAKTRDSFLPDECM